MIVHHDHDYVKLIIKLNNNYETDARYTEKLDYYASIMVGTFSALIFMPKIMLA